MFLFSVNDFLTWSLSGTIAALEISRLYSEDGIILKEKVYVKKI